VIEFERHRPLEAKGAKFVSVQREKSVGLRVMRGHRRQAVEVTAREIDASKRQP
jgi:hypothetical protein